MRNRATPTGRRPPVRSGMVAVALAVALGTASGVRAGEQAWQVPDAWLECGTVAAWRDADARFYRNRTALSPLDRSREHLDLESVYARTFRHRGSLPPVGFSAWAELGPQERDARRAAARRELGFVREFRLRILNEVQNTRANAPIAWGTRVADHTVIGDMLARLHTAVGLVPENPYAWHLYGYFAGVVGDTERALRALDGARTALAALPDAALPELRAAVALDRAWLLRERGELEAAGAALDAAVAHGARGTGPRLLQGLLAAQSGDDVTAIVAAADLRGVTVADFPVDFRARNIAPEVTNVVAWARKPSSYLHDWIMALSWLRAGRPDLAREAFGTFDVDDQRPFADRFWNDAGRIYLATGRPRMAAAAWEMARICVPYQPYMVTREGRGDLSGVTGRLGSVPFELAFGTHYQTGSRLARAASLVAELVSTADPYDRRRLAARALDELEICRRQGIFAGQAAVLEGQVYHLMDDQQSAQQAIEDALVLLDAAGDRRAFATVLAGLGRSRDELAPQDVANFYGQSGASRARWEATEDPVAARERLQAAYAADPDDETRRALARFLIRHGEADAGRELALVPLAGRATTPAAVGTLAAADVALVLEADRAAGDAELAAGLTARLAAGHGDPWDDAGVWALAGFVCLDQGLRGEARTALERAAELDPGNHGLRVQLSLM